MSKNVFLLLDIYVININSTLTIHNLLIYLGYRILPFGPSETAAVGHSAGQGVNGWQETGTANCAGNLSSGMCPFNILVIVI